MKKVASDKATVNKATMFDKALYIIPYPNPPP